MNSGKGILAVQPAVVDKLKKMGHFKNQESLCGKKKTTVVSRLMREVLVFLFHWYDHTVLCLSIHRYTQNMQLSSVLLLQPRKKYS